jgi:hypothetical protein
VIYGVANATVFDVTTETVATVPADRARRTIGVGEQVVLKVVPTEFSADWTLSGDGWLSDTAGLQCTLLAYDRTSTPSVTATCGGQSVTVSFTVVEPADQTATKIGEDVYPPGTQGVGMSLAVTVNPTNVSFTNVEMHEILYRSGTSRSGYFVNVPWSELIHHPTKPWVPLVSGNLWKDHAWIAGFPPPWQPGGDVEWIIPVYWRVKRNILNSRYVGKNIANETQTFHLDAVGTSTVIKLGCRAIRVP